MKRLIILSNCTHVGLGRYIRALDIFDSVDSHAIYEGNEAARNAIADTLDSYDCILTIKHGEKWGRLATDTLKAKYGDRLLCFPSIFFPGLHPDLCTLMGKDKKPLPSLHSATLLRLHQHGVGVDTAVRRFKSGNVPVFGDPKINWTGGIAGLRERDGQSDIGISDILDEECMKSPAMMTFNHPRMSIISRIADRAIALWFGSPPARRIDLESIRHDLFNFAIWPVYDHVAEQLELPYRTSQRFQLTPDSKTNDMSLREYIDMIFKYYSQHDSRFLRVITPGALANAVNKDIARVA